MFATLLSCLLIVVGQDAFTGIIHVIHNDSNNNIENNKSVIKSNGFFFNKPTCVIKNAKIKKNK